MVLKRCLLPELVDVIIVTTFFILRNEMMFGPVGLRVRSNAMRVV
jgi:hypothetical protein